MENKVSVFVSLKNIFLINIILKAQFSVLLNRLVLELPQHEAYQVKYNSLEPLKERWYKIINNLYKIAVQVITCTK